MRISLLAIGIAASAMGMWTTIGVSGQSMTDVCPLHAQHMKASAAAAPGSHEDMLARGAHAMGFDQLATSHHFRLSRTGGAIEVHVNDAGHSNLKAAIAGHLRTIAAQFAQGDFSTPLQVHGETPAGVEKLKRLVSDIAYEFEAGELGGRVRLVGRSEPAVAAIHEFLRYQIREHRTGDPLTIE